MKEYLMSNYYRRAKTEKMMGKARLARIIKPKLDLKAIRVFMTVDERFLNAFFEVIDNEYGGMDKFIRNQLGIDDDARKQIIEKLTY
jgi:protein-tyrosine phosphatase